jgi:hypothetical protein
MIAVLLVGAALSGACKEVAEAVVEKSVKAAKDTTKGLEEGLEQGRKQGESSDGALIVSSAGELEGKGLITVHAVRKLEQGTEIELAVENTMDRPLRVTKLSVLALDEQGFAQRPSRSAVELTVPPRAKDKLVLSFDAGGLAKVRIWDTEQTLPPAVSEPSAKEQ